MNKSDKETFPLPFQFAVSYRGLGKDKFPTGHFTILEPRDQEISEVGKRR